MSALSSSVYAAAGPALATPHEKAARAQQRHGPGLSVPRQPGQEKPWALLAVTGLHLLLLAGLAQPWGPHPAPVVQPAVVGWPVTAAPVVEPVPLPVVEPSRPLPRPAVRRQPAPLAPVAAPSERAVTAPPPESVNPEVIDVAAVAPPSPAPAVVATQAPTQVAPPEPIVPPRADAAHLNNPAPGYPPISRRLGEQGRVQLDVYILADGSVGEIKLKRSSGYPRLDQAALEAVRNWRYQPARRSNEAIAFWYVQPLTFSLDG